MAISLADPLLIIDVCSGIKVTPPELVGWDDPFHFILSSKMGGKFPAERVADPRTSGECKSILFGFPLFT